MTLNEHIKAFLDIPTMKNLYLNLFNLVLETGIAPKVWSTGCILPIYKQKGSIYEPANYRPITLLSCMGKLFTSIINERLQNFSEKYEKIAKSQAGFRRGFSTVDNIFVLNTLINLLQNSRKKLFCAFIDLKRAFDSVWRHGLWYKLNMFKINGKCFQLIRNIYKNVKSCIMLNGAKSDFFDCNIGVRQGENLSPFLFCVFLNDLESFFSDSGIVNGVECSTQVNADTAFLYLKLFVLLYADDTVILAESAEDLKSALKVYELYCNTWKLTINSSKSNVLIFSKGRMPYYEFTLNGSQLEVVSEYKYLGILFCRSGSFLRAKKHIADQARKAVFALLKKAKQLLLPIDIQIDLFNKCIRPILLYGCEVWGYGNVAILEQVQLRFLKFVLNLKKTTPNYIVYGETGVLPLRIEINYRIISYWTKLVSADNNKLCSQLYFIAKSYFDNLHGTNNFSWIEHVRLILTLNGFSGIWDTHQFPNRIWLAKAIKQKLTDLFLNEWKDEVETKPSSYIYRIFKADFEFEYYLTHVPFSLRKYLLKFRTLNHKLPVEKGRWRNIPRTERKCHLCLNDIGDEYHYLMVCTSLKPIRKKYLAPYFCKRPNTFKFEKLMKSKNPTVLRKLCLFIKYIFELL